MSDNPILLTIGQCYDILVPAFIEKLAKQTFYLWVKDKKIRTVTIGKKSYIPYSEMQKLIEQSK